MTRPDNPIDAVTHLDPYPYYAELVAHQPIYRDEALGLWVASSAAAVNAVLHSELCRVRPPAEPVPKALLGSPAAEIFRHLVRMNDGVAHCPFKLAIAATLESIAASDVSELSQHWARFLSNDLSPVEHTARLSDFAFQLPVYVV